MHAESGLGFADCALDSVRARLSVSTISADVTDETAAHRILSQIRPQSADGV